VLTFNQADGACAVAMTSCRKPFRTAELLAKIGALLELRWRETGPCAPKIDANAPLPDAARAALQDLLADGDLAAFRAALALFRAENPAVESRWQELDEAAAGFQLSRLRQLLETG
jgi:hypothetical protein